METFWGNSKGYAQAIFIDNGLFYAEKLIRERGEFQVNEQTILVDLNLKGLQCKWSEVRPPLGREEILCLIIHANDFSQHEKIYSTVLDKIREIYGDFAERRPLKEHQLLYSMSLENLGQDPAGDTGYDFFYKVINHLKQKLNKLHLRLGLISPFEHKHKQLGQLISATDSIRSDGRLKTIITGNKDQGEKLLDFLNKKEGEGELIFGHFSTKSTIMTCFINKKEGEFINFLDGAGGGFFQAAIELKKKIKQQDVQGSN